MKSYLKNYTNQCLKNSKEGESIPDLKLTLSYKNQFAKYLLCVKDVFSRYAWV